jgi:hypothetical protein
MMSFAHSAWPLIQFRVIGEAWRLYKRHWGVWSLAMLIVLLGESIVSSAVFGMLGLRHSPHHHGGFRWPITPIRGAVGYHVSFAIAGFFLGGMIRMASNQIRGRAPRLEHLFSITDVWLDLLLGSVLYGAAIFVAAWFCFVPAFLAAGVFMFTLPLVVEGKLPATGAMMQSWHALKSQWLAATVFHLILSLLAGSGALLCGIGLLVTGPLYSLSVALLYHDFFPYSATSAFKPAKNPFADI